MKLLKYASDKKMDKDTKDAIRRSAVASTIGFLPVGATSRAMINRIYAAGEGHLTDNKHSVVGAFGGPTAVSGARAKDTGNSTALATIGTGAAVTGVLGGAVPLLTSEKKLKRDAIENLKAIQNGATGFVKAFGDESAKKDIMHFNNGVDEAIEQIERLSPQEINRMKKTMALKGAGAGAVSGAILGGMGYGFGKLFGSKKKKDDK